MAPVVAARVLLHAWLTATDCDVTCLDAVCRRIEHSVDRPGPSPPPGGGTGHLSALASGRVDADSLCCLLTLLASD